MVRRFVYDPGQDRVVEVPVLEHRTLSPAEQYEQMLTGYREKQRVSSGEAEKAGQVLRAASLERADRREFAHRRFGDEKRWRET